MKPARVFGKSLAQLVPQVLAPALKAHGIATAEIIAHWDDLVGARFAPVTRPLRITWPRRPEGAPPDRATDPATLVVRCESAHALEFQHSIDHVLERINALYGWHAIGRVTIRQGPVRELALTKPAAPDAPLQPALARAVAAVEDEELRAALDRLGRAISGASRTSRGKP